MPSTKSWDSYFAGRQSAAPTPGSAWRLPRFGKRDVPLMVYTKKAEFRGHKDIWQNPQDKDETNKATRATVLNQVQLHEKVVLAGTDHSHQLMATHPKNAPTQKKRVTEHMD